MRHVTAVFLVLILAGLAQAQNAKPANTPRLPGTPAAANATSELPSEATVQSFMQHMFGYDPSLEWKVLAITPAEAPQVAAVTVAMKGEQGTQNLLFYVLPGAQWAIAGEIFPFGADPFARARAQLAAEAHGPARGPVDAAVTIVEFSDLECPSCKQAQPTIERLLTDMPNVRFIFQNFPLEALHPWAFRAAAYADCVGRANNEAFWKFVHTVYENQEQVTPENVDQKLTELAQQAGVNGSQMAACAAQPATAERVRQSQALGEALHVGATPTLFINGRAIPNLNGMPYEVLTALAKGTPK